MYSAGIDIGENIKCVLLKKGKVIKKETFAINEIGKVAQFTKSSKSINVIISSAFPDVVLKILEVPDVPKKVLQQSIKNEIEEKTTITNLDDYNFDYTTMQKTEDSLKVLALSISKRLFKELSLLENIKNIEHQATAFSKLEEVGDSIVVDIMNEHSKAYFYKDSKISHFKHIEVGKRNMMIGAGAETIANELRQEINAVEIETGDTFNNIIFTNSVTENIDIKEFFEGSVDKSVLVLENEEYSNIINIAKQKKNEKRLNFAKYTKKSSQKPLFLILGLLITLQIGGFAVSYNIERKTEEYNEVITNAQERMREIRNKMRENGENERISIDSAKEEEVNKKWLSDALFFIPENTPVGIVLTKIEIKDNLSLEGEYDSYSNIGFFASNLENLGYKISINKIEDGIFDITANQ